MKITQAECFQPISIIIETLHEAQVMKASSEASEGAFGEFFEYSGLCDKGEAREVWEASQNSFKQRVIELLEEHWGKSIDRINFLHEIENL